MCPATRASPATTRRRSNWGPPALDVCERVGRSKQRPICRERHFDTCRGLEIIKTIPRHTFTMGATFEPQHVNVVSQQDARGTFSFTGAASGSDLADFLLGIPATSSIAFGNADKRLRARNADAYISDDWRVTPTLTVNAGIRWEYESPFTETGNRLVNLDVAAGFTAVSPVLASDGVGSTTGQRYPARCCVRIGEECSRGWGWRGVRSPGRRS